MRLEEAGLGSDLGHGAGHGDVQLADYTSTDREGPLRRRHPWDEALVVDGYVES